MSGNPKRKGDGPRINTAMITTLFIIVFYTALFIYGGWNGTIVITDPTISLVLIVIMPLVAGTIIVIYLVSFYNKHPPPASRGAYTKFKGRSSS